VSPEVAVGPVVLSRDGRRQGGLGARDFGEVVATLRIVQHHIPLPLFAGA